jgi:phage terminase large subunit
MSRIVIKVPPKFSTLSKAARYHVFYGGRGSAKSHSIARYLICAALSEPLKILCTRELQNSIGDSVHKLLVDLIVNHNLESWFTIKNNEIDVYNGGQFIFKGLAHNIDSIKSTEGVDICWIEEADKVSQSSWDILIPTIRKPASRILISFNPNRLTDPVYQKFVVNQAPDAIVTEVTHADNPHFPDVLKREMEYCKAVDYDKYLHIWEGKLRTHSEALVFNRKYVVEEFEAPPGETLRYGADWGFAKDPTTLVRCFVSGRNLYVDYEVYGHGIELTELDALFRHVPNSDRWPILADNARPETISYMKNQGWKIDAAPKWQGSVEDGLEFMRSFEKIIIHPRCKNTIKEFSNYSYKVDKRTGEVLPLVEDDNNHTIDAIRYALSNLIKRKVTIYDSGFF